MNNNDKNDKITIKDAFIVVLVFIIIKEWISYSPNAFNWRVFAYNILMDVMLFVFISIVVFGLFKNN